MKRFGSIFLSFLFYLHIFGQSFSGGVGDGFSATTFEVSLGVTPYFLGGIGDGFDMNSVFSSAPNYYLGGIGDGFDLDSIMNQGPTYYLGSSGDGFALSDLMVSFECMSIQNNKWTGAGDGVSWDDINNWEGSIPTLCDDVIIDKPTDTVSVPNGFIAKAHSVKVDGALHISNLANLFIDMDSSTVDNGLYALGGRIYNFGLVNIRDISSGNIVRAGVRVNNGFFVNHGNIEISNLLGAASTGIYTQSNGVFHNRSSGIVGITDVNNSIGYAIRNRSIIENEGTISINQSNTSLGHAAIFNQSKLVNSGSIHLKQVNFGIDNTDSLFNSGIIHVQNILVEPAINLNSSLGDPYFQNLPSGQISIGHSADFAINNLNQSSFLNEGNIFIDSVQTDGLQNFQSTFTNQGLIDIKNIKGNGILSNSTFTNSGSITIDSTEESGIQTNFNGFFKNDGGNIYINNSGMNVAGFNVQDSLFSSGHIEIKDINGPCFYFFTSKQINNEGSLHCENFIGHGIQLDNTRFKNSGNINIYADPLKPFDFYFEVGLGSVFDNSQTLNIGVKNP